MFLKKTPHKNNRIYLSICKSYRKPNTKKTLQKTVKSLGYVDELEKDYKDPLGKMVNSLKSRTSVCLI